VTRIFIVFVFAYTVTFFYVVFVFAYTLTFIVIICIVIVIILVVIVIICIVILVPQFCFGNERRKVLKERKIDVFGINIYIFNAVGIYRLQKQNDEIDGTVFSRNISFFTAHCYHSVRTYLHRVVYLLQLSRSDLDIHHPNLVALLLNLM